MIIEYFDFVLCVLESVMTDSTTSYEPLEPHDPSLNNLAKKMFSATADYLQGELTLIQVHYP